MLTRQNVCSLLLDFLAPPRPSERIVRELTLPQLWALAREAGGALPYRDERVRALVWELKYYANRRAAALAGELFSEVLLAIAAQELGPPLLVPVPMSPARRRKRGHNQTELLCEAALAHAAGCFDYAPEALVRIRYTRPQQGLAKRARLGNVRGSMAALRPERVAGRVCVIVDDVSTTGATFAEAARALRHAGALRVEYAALAR